MTIDEDELEEMRERAKDSSKDSSPPHSPSNERQLAYDALRLIDEVERLREWANQADEVFDDVHHEAEKYETKSARDIYQEIERLIGYLPYVEEYTNES